MGAWIASEFWAEYRSDIGITLTPVDDGRLEVLVDGEMLFDRKAEGGAYPALDKVRLMKEAVKEKLAGVVGAR